jgi:hypothetical protein
MEPSNAQKLRAAIKSAISQEGSSPDAKIAGLVKRAEPALVATWADEILEALVRSLRRRIPTETSQMQFPFDDLSIQLPREKDITYELRSATLGMLKESEKFLLAKQRSKLDKPARASSLLGKIQREIELMQPWIYLNRRITTEKVHALVLAGTPLPPRNTGPLSEAMKRYWSAMSPEERSYLTQERQAKRRKRERGRGANS